MPSSPPQLCSVVGCPNLVRYGRCPEHQAEARREHNQHVDSHRPSGYARGYTRAWARFSHAYLDTHLVCEDVSHLTQPEWLRPPSTDVDHIDGHSRTCRHAFDEANVRALCHSCHSRKTYREDGSFGRSRLNRCDG